MKKTICALACIMMFIPLANFTGALTGTYEEQLENKEDIAIGQIFMTCYIEASGKIGEDGGGFFQFGMWKTFWFRPFLDNRAFVTYWHIPFDPDGQVTIYSSDGGQVLWDYKGEQRVNILGYFGTYIPSVIEGSLHVTISGNALVAMPKQY
jgi:hypothetical protein